MATKEVTLTIIVSMKSFHIENPSISNIPTYYTPNSTKFSCYHSERSYNEKKIHSLGINSILIAFVLLSLGV